jgi:hypothetical protein
MDNMSFEFLRKRFDKLNGYYGKKGIAPQLSYLRIEENLENGKGSYQFNLKKENLNRLVENGSENVTTCLPPSVLACSCVLRIA